MKNKKLIITLIILLSFIAIALIIFFIGLIKNDFKLPYFKSNYNVSNKLVIDKNYNQLFDKINLDLDEADVYIKKSQTKDTRVAIYGNKENITISNDNNTLEIKLKKEKCIGFCFNKKISKVNIYLPTDYDKEININNNYGNIKIEEFNKAIMNITEDCGDVEIQSANIANIKNKYGDININKVNISKIEEDCGDVFINTVNSVTVKNSYGEIEITNINKYLNIKNDCGDIELGNVNLTKNSYIKNDYGDIEIDYTNKIFIDATTDLGDVEVKDNFNKSDITLKIKNDCGDINVNK